MRPWYTPPSKSVPAGPRIVKCHSKRLSSRGSAKYCEEGSRESSRTSAKMRFFVNVFSACPFIFAGRLAMSEYAKK
jgi:hypothetical protein